MKFSFMHKHKGLKRYLYSEYIRAHFTELEYGATPRPGSFWSTKEREQECRGARGSMSEQQSGLAKSEVTHRENGPEENCNASVCISSREAAASTPCGVNSTIFSER